MKRKSIFVVKRESENVWKPVFVVELWIFYHLIVDLILILKDKFQSSI